MLEEIQSLAYGLKKRIKIIALFTVVLTLGGWFMANNSMHTSYEARVKIFAGKTDEIQGDYSVDELSDYSSLMNTYIQLIRTEDFMAEVIEKADLDMSPIQLVHGFQFIPTSGTPILQIKYTASSPEVAEKVLTALTEEFDKGVSEVIVNTHTVVIDSVKVSTIVPNKNRVIQTGFIVGLILGLGIAILLDYLDDTITRKEDLEKIIPIAVIGEISVDTEATAYDVSKGNSRSKKRGAKK